MKGIFKAFYEKTKCVAQSINNNEKETILTQAFTIMRCNQQLNFAGIKIALIRYVLKALQKTVKLRIVMLQSVFFYYKAQYKLRNNKDANKRYAKFWKLRIYGFRKKNALKSGI
ncbi:hypothetical protein GGTG_05168 [Gaeumannomyces tritici R3-111a-1]|uniref:Uncharacterized protein n=1 Tax=Gaeumannomyces tritici (strain R3-111a-1) TaxID=644352 RepID=J3NV55_GAET3|nr:hypothetical protein GGTG_05168 [Gaeumannomyces tritici R3-111a-1]EJT75231.1 hypothetical protein GGTG_05168 [Gaeumannomyces tritici R3-111a-1]